MRKGGGRRITRPVASFPAATVTPARELSMAEQIQSYISRFSSLNNLKASGFQVGNVRFEA